MLNATPRESVLDWTFPKGSCIQFAHLEQEKNIYDYQGAQLVYLAFDELTHFTIRQFFYLLSRQRSMSGISGYCRGSCNPDPDQWLRQFISWWIDPDTGYPVPERSGVIRWFIRDGDKFVWADSKHELIKAYGELMLPKSVTFISAKIFDNKILLEKDPSYLSNLMAQAYVDRMQLLEGNWNIRPAAGTLFKRQWFEVVEAIPKQIVRAVRAWDKAATKVDESTPPGKDPDHTAGVKIEEDKNGIFYITDVRRVRDSVGEVKRLILNTARQDGMNCRVKLFQDPGAAGVHEADDYIKTLKGFDISVEKISKSKVTAAKPISAQAEAGNIKILRAAWNEEFFRELEAFPEGKHDDMVDAMSSCYNELNAYNVGDFTDSMVQDDIVTSINLNGDSIW
jgi:predicted phage terminase large subunit-like protein